jgi:hypothetical protein
MSDSTCRRASTIRIAFKTMTTQRLPRPTAFEKFGVLWDETNHAAVLLLDTPEIAEYLALLKEMDKWYQEQLKISG